MQDSDRDLEVIEPSAVLFLPGEPALAFGQITFILDRGEPLVAQIVNQLAFLLATCALQPGSRLPSLDTASKEWKVSRNVALACYHELEKYGITSNNLRTGTFFTSHAAQSARRYLITQKTKHLISHGIALGLQHEEIVGVFLASMDEIQRDTERKSQRK